MWSLASSTIGTYHLTPSEFDNTYNQQRGIYENEFNVSSRFTQWGRGFYDAVWSLAISLNASLEELNNIMNLTHITTGSRIVASTNNKFSRASTGFSRSLRED